MITRQDPTARKRDILQAALELASIHGYDKMTRRQIGERLECAPSLVAHYFKTADQLRRSVMREAVRVECLPVIARGLALGDKQAAKAPEAVRRAALATLGV